MTRDPRGRSEPPVAAGDAARKLVEHLTPETATGSIQAIWPRVVGEAIADVTTIISERDGTLEVGCQSAVWADELSMMEPGIRAKLNAALAEGKVESIKFRTGR